MLSVRDHFQAEKSLYATPPVLLVCSKTQDATKSPLSPTHHDDDAHGWEMRAKKQQRTDSIE